MKINNIANNYNFNSLSQKRNNKTFNSSSALLKADNTVSSPSFTGKPKWMEAVSQFESEQLSKLYSKMADTGLIKKISGSLAKSNNSFTHLMVLDSAILSTFYTISALINPKIKKEQKPQMVINDALTFGVSATGSYLLDGKVTNYVEKLTEAYFEKNKDFYKNVDKSVIENTKTGINKIKTLVIFGMIYRYFGPVLVTPLANKISSKFFDGKAKEKTQQAK